MSGVANKDVLYSLVFVGCYGTWMFLARAVDFGAAGPGAGNDVYTRTVLTSATLLLAAFWAVLACSAYVVYDQACRSLAHRFRSREKQDEMIKLMHAIDDSTLTPASVYAAHPYVADQQEEKPATVNLRHRNDLLVTMYVVGVALYFTMIGCVCVCVSLSLPPCAFRRHALPHTACLAGMCTERVRVHVRVYGGRRKVWGNWTPYARSRSQWGCGPLQRNMHFYAPAAHRRV